jgi:hypothetical protein
MPNAIATIHENDVRDCRHIRWNCESPSAADGCFVAGDSISISEYMLSLAQIVSAGMSKEDEQRVEI